MNKRIDLTWFERFPQHDEEDCAIITDDTYALNWEVPKLIAELKKCYEELDRPKVTIDDWDKEGPCVTVYLEGKEYVGILREYDASE